MLDLGKLGANDASGAATTGTIALNKLDAGVWTLTGAGAFSGATGVSAGVLELNATAYLSDIAIGSGATLRGVGVSANAVTAASGGVFAPGAASGAGVLTSAALSLGADAAMVGRPVLWALAAGSADAVAELLAALDDDLRHVMALAGARTTGELTRDLLVGP